MEATTANHSVWQTAPTTGSSTARRWAYQMEQNWACSLALLKASNWVTSSELRSAPHWATLKATQMEKPTGSCWEYSKGWQTALTMAAKKAVPKDSMRETPKECCSGWRWDCPKEQSLASPMELRLAATRGSTKALMMER